MATLNLSSLKKHSLSTETPVKKEVAPTLLTTPVSLTPKEIAEPKDCRAKISLAQFKKPETTQSPIILKTEEKKPLESNITKENSAIKIGVPPIAIPKEETVKTPEVVSVSEATPVVEATVQIETPALTTTISEEETAPVTEEKKNGSEFFPNLTFEDNLFETIVDIPEVKTPEVVSVSEATPVVEATVQIETPALTTTISEEETAPIIETADIITFETVSEKKTDLETKEYVETVAKELSEERPQWGIAAFVKKRSFRIAAVSTLLFGIVSISLFSIPLLFTHEKANVLEITPPPPPPIEKIIPEKTIPQTIDTNTGAENTGAIIPTDTIDTNTGAVATTIRTPNIPKKRNP